MAPQPPLYSLPLTTRQTPPQDPPSPPTTPSQPLTNTTTIIWVVAVSIIAFLLLATLTTLLTLRLSHRRAFARALASEPTLTLSEFNRRRKLTHATLTLEDERRRHLLIHKSLTTRSSESSFHSTFLPVQSNQSHHHQQQQQQPPPRPPRSPIITSPTLPIIPTNPRTSLPLKDDYKQWEAAIRHERTISNENHPAFVPSPSSTTTYRASHFSIPQDVMPPMRNITADLPSPSPVSPITPTTTRGRSISHPTVPILSVPCPPPAGTNKLLSHRPSLSAPGGFMFPVPAASTGTLRAAVPAGVPVAVPYPPPLVTRGTKFGVGGRGTGTEDDWYGSGEGGEELRAPSPPPRNPARASPRNRGAPAPWGVI